MADLIDEASDLLMHEEEGSVDGVGLPEIISKRLVVEAYRLREENKTLRRCFHRLAAGCVVRKVDRDWPALVGLIGQGLECGDD